MPWASPFGTLHAGNVPWQGALSLSRIAAKECHNGTLIFAYHRLGSAMPAGRITVGIHAADLNGRFRVSGATEEA